jgi:hypothetical protein
MTVLPTWTPAATKNSLVFTGLLSNGIILTEEECNLADNPMIVLVKTNAPKN